MTDTNQINHPPDPRTRAGAPFIDKRTTPLGVLPRHLQLWVLIGIAVVMVGIMSLSGVRAPARASSSTAGASLAPTASAIDPNQQRIEEYQRRIQEQAQRLAAEQAQLQLTKEAVAHGASAAQAPNSSPSDSGPTTRSAAPVRPTRDELVRHVSDNVAFPKDRGVAAAPPAPAEAAPMPSWPPFVWPTTTPSITSTSAAGAAPTGAAPATPAASVTPPGPAAADVRTDALTGQRATHDLRYR